MCEVKKCEYLRLKPFLCMIWKEKVARHVDFGCLLGAKQACNHIVRNEIRGGGVLRYSNLFQMVCMWYQIQSNFLLNSCMRKNWVVVRKTNAWLPWQPKMPYFAYFHFFRKNVKILIFCSKFYPLQYPPHSLELLKGCQMTGF